MTRTITTISDARHLVTSWTERFNEQLTSDEVNTVARALVEFIGGYGNEYDTEAHPHFSHPLLGE